MRSAPVTRPPDPFGPCFAIPHSSWSRHRPPPTPLRIAPLCSPCGIVLASLAHAQDDPALNAADRSAYSRSCARRCDDEGDVGRRLVEAQYADAVVRSSPRERICQVRASRNETCAIASPAAIRTPRFQFRWRREDYLRLCREQLGALGPLGTGLPCGIASPGVCRARPVGTQPSEGWLPCWRP
jgi:hypothetical protein